MGSDLCVVFSLKKLLSAHAINTMYMYIYVCVIYVRLTYALFVSPYSSESDSGNSAENSDSSSGINFWVLLLGLQNYACIIYG